MHIRLIRDMWTDWELPGELFHSYGWYHLTWIGICVLVSVFLAVRFARRHDTKTDERILFGIGAILIAAEIYKQLFYLRLYGWEYRFWVLPWQFCSVPMYVLFAVPFCKKERVRNMLLSYIGYYGLLAGVATMTWPEDMLNTTYVTILIHTMLWHSLMVIAGVYTVTAKGFGRNYFKEVLPGFSLFVVLTLTAIVLNETVGRKLPGFNLFYLSYRNGSSLPVLSGFYRPGDGVFRWILLIVSYFAAFSIGTFLEFTLFRLIRSRRRAPKANDLTHDTP